MKKKCPKCGTEVDEDAEFCPNCWYVFNKDEFPNDLGLLGLIASSTPKLEPTQPTEPTVFTQPKREEPTNPQPVPKPKLVTKPVAQTKPIPAPTQPSKSTLSKPKSKATEAPLRPITPKLAKTFKQKMNEPIKLEQKKKHKKAKSKSMVEGNPYLRTFYRLIGIFVVLIAIFAVLCVVGGNHYSKDKQIIALTAKLNKPSQKIDQAHLANMGITVAELKPLQTYYAQHPVAFSKLKRDLRKNQAALKVVQKGNYFALFPRYALKIPTYTVRVSTNQAASQLAINQKNYGQLNKAKTFKLYPGIYNFVVTKQKQKVAKQVDVWSNQNIVLKTKIIVKKKAKPKHHAKNSSQMIVALLKRNFKKPRARDFVNGVNNNSYQILANTTKNTQQVKIHLQSKIETKPNHYFVAYQVIYKFTSGAKRTLNYSNCTIKNQKIVSIGRSRLAN